MDTPDRNQIATPISKFEDSPVFNYISSLSPIKPVKSLHIAQTLNSLTFSSLPSIFTTPHVSSHKESRFIRRYQHSDLSKPEFACENGTKVCANEGVGMDAAQMYDNSAELQENFDPGISIGETPAETAGEHFKFPIELPRALKYDCGSPNYCLTPCSPDMKSVLQLPGASTSPVQKASEKGPCEDEMHVQGICQIKQKKEETASDWEDLISDAADLLIFNSHNDTEAFEGLIQRPPNCGSRFGTSIMSQFPQDDVSNNQKMLLINQQPSGEQHLTDHSYSQFGEASGLEEIDQSQDLASTNLNECMACNLNEETDNEPALNLHRGIRRRCLDFEMTGARRNNLHDISSCSTLSQSEEMIASNNKPLVTFKTAHESSRCTLPGIGLHLNALTATSKDYKSLEHKTLSSGRLLLNCSTSNLHSLDDDQESFHRSLILAPSETDTDPAENGVQLAEDASQSSANLVTEELNQNSPKKKRRRLEDPEENEGCKRCNCKKTKCLKLYCECFAAGVYCIEPCSCQDCFNKPIHEDTVLATRKQIESRNPLAFAPKVIRSSESIPEIGDESTKTPASARHKRGCNCKKSSCLKKYCECYQGGVGCSINCRCEGCKNAFGRKDGSALVETEAEPEEADTCEIDDTDKAMQKTEIQNTEEYNSTSTLPITPLHCRLSVHLPFQSSSKPPRSSLPNVGPVSGLYGRPNILRSQSKLERHFQTVSADEMPEILRGSCSPTNSIKTVSPNSKRVSPPLCTFGSSPSRRNGRKLILQSIPSFPSLTPHQ